MGYLIDSSVFIEIERRKLAPSIVSRIADDDNLFISAMTMSELLGGVHRAKDMRRQRIRETFVESVLDAFPILSFDSRVARLHASAWAALTFQGQMIGANDLIIAATAIAHDLTVFTDNVRDFMRVPGLVMLQPDWSNVR